MTGVGVAVNVPVIREAMVRSHLVLHAGVGYALLCGEEEKICVAVYTLAHEAAHVHDQAQREKAIPGLALNQLRMSAEDWYLFGASCACWDEYAACRLSGRIVPSPGDYESRRGVVSVPVRRRARLAHRGVPGESALPALHRAKRAQDGHL
jgi:hypothetical protein